jgi:hypothetical protein
MAVLAHGAGAPLSSPFMAGIAQALPPLGVATLRFNFPYLEKGGRRAPDRPPLLLETWRAAFAVAVERAAGIPVFAGGKSMGGRIASMAVAEGMPAAGLVFLGYPLHPPGRPDKLRDEHLAAITVPMLWLQGSRDTFAQPDLLQAVVGRLGDRARLVLIEGGDHSFKVAGGSRDGRLIAAGLAPVVAEFCLGQT